MEGPARLMPWNSTKTGVNTDHLVFQHIRPTLVPLMTYFSTLSRRLKEDWAETVFRHKSGTGRRHRTGSIRRGPSKPSSSGATN